jgi:hypothetical protein
MLALGALALSSVLLVSCSAPDGPVAIQTGPSGEACLLVGFGGVLVADQTYGLALRAQA